MAVSGGVKNDDRGFSQPDLSPRARTSLRDFVDDEPTTMTGPVAEGDDPTVAIGPGAAFQPVDADEENAIIFDSVVRRQPRRDEDVLLVCAEPLLVLAAHLRTAVEYADVVELRRRVTEEIERFEERTAKAGVAPGEITAARYALCSFIDETVLMTPWGTRSTWSNNSLLNEFHNETWGGEKVFQLLDRVSENPRKYIGLLKLLDAVLMLGFEGRFRVIEGGREQLETIRANLGRLIRDHSPPPPATLSPAFEVDARRRRGLRSFVPLWMVFLGAGLLSLSVYLYAKLSLEADLRQVLQEIGRLARLVS